MINKTIRTVVERIKDYQLKILFEVLSIHFFKRHVFTSKVILSKDLT